MTAPKGAVALAPVAPVPDDAGKVAADTGASVPQTDSAAAKTPETAILEVPAGSEFSRPKSDEVAQVPGGEASPALAEAPAVAPPAEEPSPALTDKATAAQPSGQTEAPTTMTEPAAEPDTAAKAASAEVKTEADAPLAKVPGAGQDSGLPAAEPAPTAGSAAPLPSPDTAPKSAAAPAIDTTPMTEAKPAPAVTPTTEAPKVAVTAPAPEVVPPQPESSVPEPSAPADDIASAAPESLPEMDESVPDASMFDEPVPDASASDAGATAPGLPKILELSPQAPQGQTGLSQPGLPQPGLKRLVPGVKVNRLPSIGTDTATAVLPENTPPLPTVVTPAPEAKHGDALQRNAAKFSNPDNKPVLAILLLDIGVEAGGLDANALAGLPFVATIALDPQRKDAAEAAAAYRAAGSEVAILAGDLPQGATPADLEVAYQSYVQVLPDAVAFTGAPTAEFQTNRLTAQHVAQLLAADGRGFLTYEQGLNPGKQAAERAGTAHATIEKLFGQAEDNSGTLGRELNRAAFDAGQRGVRVIALPTTPEAITGLMAWAASPAATAVAIAPVSAVMLGSAGN